MCISQIKTDGRYPGELIAGAWDLGIAGMHRTTPGPKVTLMYIYQMNERVKQHHLCKELQADQTKVSIRFMLRSESRFGYTGRGFVLRPLYILPRSWDFIPWAMGAISRRQCGQISI